MWSCCCCCYCCFCFYRRHRLHRLRHQNKCKCVKWIEIYSDSSVSARTHTLQTTETVQIKTNLLIQRISVDVGAYTHVYCTEQLNIPWHRNTRGCASLYDYVVWFCAAGNQNLLTLIEICVVNCQFRKFFFGKIQGPSPFNNDMTPTTYTGQLKVDHKKQNKNRRKKTE